MKKRNKIHNLQLHLVYQYSNMCVLIKHTFCESLVKPCVTKLKCRSFFLKFFSDIGQCFCPSQTKSLKNQKSGHVRIIKDDIP